MDASPEQRDPQNAQKPRDPRTEAIIGAAIEVHRTLGAGYLERVYHEALKVELGRSAVPFASEVELPIHYKGERLPVAYRADLFCFGDILVELKAQSSVGAVEAAQVINYLKACHQPVGLLLNFGQATLQVKRFAGPAHFHRTRSP